MLRHLPFYDLLATHDRHSPEWTEGTAALMVLRLFDDWIGHPAIATLKEGGVPYLRYLISKIANPEVRHLLGDAVTVLRKADRSESSFAVGPLLAYAWHLDDTQWYTLAADALATVLGMLSLRNPADFRLAATTYEHLGQALSQQVRLDEASRSFGQMGLFAELCSDQGLVLKSVIHRTATEERRGHLEELESLLHNPIKQAHRIGNREVESLGHRAIGGTLIAAARYRDALRELQHAYAAAPNRVEQEWVLCDIAACMVGLGQTHIARPIHEHLAKTAQRPPARVLARTNLLEIAVLEGDQAAFNTHWRALNTRLSLHAALFTDFYYAKGIERWQGYRAAAPLYTAVIERAKTTGAHGIARQVLAYL